MEFKAGGGALFACMWGVAFCVTGLPLYTLGVFAQPISAEFGWRLSDFSLAPLFVQGGLVVSVPVVGFLIDRYGARRIALISIPVLAAAVASLSTLQGSLVAFLALALAIPLLGGGASGITYARVVNGWFSVARGRALGLLAGAIGLMSIFGPRVVQLVVDAYGWRIGYLIVAAAVLSPLPVAWLLLREKREMSSANTSRHAQLAAEPGIDAPQALSSRLFATLALGFICIAIPTGAMIFIVVPFLTSQGMERADAAALAGIFGAASLTGRVVMGWVFDRVNAAWACALVFICGAIGLVVLALTGIEYAALCIGIVGFMLGTDVDAMSYLTARYFGMRAFGKIAAVIQASTSLFAGAGPFLLAKLAERAGGFTMPLLLLAGITLLGAIAMALVARKPFQFGAS